MKKYTPVFGPQELFDGAANCDGYLVAVQHSVGQKTKVSFYPSLVEAFNYVTDFPPRGVIFHRAAMRRIINPPVWTVADQQAGRLPEVGCKCVWVNLSGTESPDDLLYPEVGEEIEIVANTKTYDGKYQVSVFKWLHDDGETQCYAASGHVEDFKPIETPAEKAQREENEFVKSEMKDTTLSIEWACIYERGVRAAYRKLKGGE